MSTVIDAAVKENTSAMPSMVGSNHESLATSTVVRLGVSVLIALVVAFSFGLTVSEPDFWIRASVTAFASYIGFFFVTESFLKASPRKVPEGQEQENLIDSITGSRRAAYAISSNWIDLWTTTTFRQYLAIDSITSLVHFSSSRGTTLERLSNDERDKQEFIRYGWNLLEEIASGHHPLSKTRLRLLIYPEWVYSNFANEINTLIRMHSIARIPCIPIVSEKLAEQLSSTENVTLKEVTESLGQTTRDKLPPLSFYERARYARHLKKVSPSSKRFVLAFPDMLLIDPSIDFDSASVYSYSESGNVQRWPKTHTKFSQAVDSFEIICKHARSCEWPGYGLGSIGGVTIGIAANQLDSEVFFSKSYYSDWLDWIETKKEKNSSAEKLNRWQEAEEASMLKFVKGVISERELSGEKSILGLDAGCGFGRHAIHLLKEHPDLRMRGVDINASMTSDATRASVAEGLDGRASFNADDLADLESVDDGSVDFVICMTNTLGNLTGEKRSQFISRVAEILKPGGRLLLSCYNTGSSQVRLESYEAIGLDATERGSRIVASEGLVSESFTNSNLENLLRHNGLELVKDIQSLTSIAWKAEAYRPA